MTGELPERSGVSADDERSTGDTGRSEPPGGDGVDSGGEAVGRRTALRAVAASAVVAGGLLSVPGFAAARGEGVAVSADDVEPPNDVQVRKVDRSVRSLSRHYPVLTLPQETVLSYVDESDLSGRERGQARRAVADLRSEFPVVPRREGNVTWLTLATDRRPTDDHAEAFETAGKALARGAAGGAPAGGPSTQQFGSIHRKMTRRACEQMGFGSATVDELAAHADDPDNPNVELGLPDGIPHLDTVEEGVENALEEVMHHYGQYYDADAFQVYEDGDHAEDFYGLGGAPAAADWHVYWADYYSGSAENEYLGKATHYPQDMGVPLHTGMGWEQANLDIYYDIWSLSMDWSIDPLYWLHSAYERFVADEWDRFEYHFETHCDGCYYYYPIDGVPEAIRDLASFTGDYSYEVYHRIMDEGDVGWENWSWSTRDYMYDITENCMNETGLYTRGFIHDVKRD